MGQGEFSDPAAEFQITLCLFRVKQTVAAGEIQFIDRKKNMATLTQLGMTVQNAIDALLGLGLANYVSGPETDHDTGEPKCIWKFGILIENEEIYVKLKLLEEQVKELSFHISERKLDYPYAEV